MALSNAAVARKKRNNALILWGGLEVEGCGLEVFGVEVWRLMVMGWEVFRVEVWRLKVVGWRALGWRFEVEGCGLEVFGVEV